jgi:hypothetical protein
MKRKLGDLAPGHTIHTQCKQALPSGLTCNLHLLKYALSWPLPTLRPAGLTPCGTTSLPSPRRQTSPGE